MNRAERRKAKKRGKSVGREPVLMMRPSDIVKAATQGVGKQAMIHEINQQILEKDRGYQLDIDTMVLWSIRLFTGWGPKKLKNFYQFMFKEHLRMREFYELDDMYPERYKLKEKGIDVEAWYQEMFTGDGSYREV